MKEIMAGFDVAEQGEDLSTFITCTHEDGAYRMIDVQSWGKSDLMPTVGKAVDIIIKNKIEKVTVDSSGVGSGVYSRLDELRNEKKISCKVVAYKGGQSPSTGTGKERFLNIKAEQYWRLRDLFEKGNIKIMKHKLLIDQLNKMKWEFTSSRKIRIRDPGEKEGDTAEKKSPDFSDALMLCCSETGPIPMFMQKVDLFSKKV